MHDMGAKDHGGRPPCILGDEEIRFSWRMDLDKSIIHKHIGSFKDQKVSFWA